MATDGLITISSGFAAKETMDRLEAQIKTRGMTVLARVAYHLDPMAGCPLFAWVTCRA